MSRALTRIVGVEPPTKNVDVLWKEAIDAASRSRRPRSWGKESAADRMRRLRDSIQKELVGFHDTLIVKAHKGDLEKTMQTSTLYDVQIPITLFPKRDQGFSRIECLVEFSVENEGDFIRVRKLYPEERSEVLARAQMGGRLDFKTNAKVGLAIPPSTVGSTVGEVSGEVYATGEIGAFVYEARRACVQAEIVKGSGARWRLDDIHNPQQVGTESHQLQIVLEVNELARPVHAAGYLTAYSDRKWLTSALGTLWRDFKGDLGKFFSRGLPIEAYAEWEDIISN